MPQQRIVWTVLPYGRAEDGAFAGRLRVSIVVSPRLTPLAADEQTLGAFQEWLNWPQTLNDARFGLRIGAAPPIDLQVISQVDPALWTRLFSPATPVAGFVFKNMALVNLRSFAVRNVLGLMRKHYGALAVQSAGTHPTLLPWKNAHPGLKGMLTELGTRTQKINLGNQQIEVPLPGFDRFFDQDNPEGLERRLGDLVFGPRSRFQAEATGVGVDEQGNPVTGATFPVRALPPDWIDPIGGGASAPVMSQFSTAAEYTLYQANRFYRREPLTKNRIDQLAAQDQLRRPKLVNVPKPPPAPDYDFHRIVASFADYPAVLRALGLVIDCVLPADSAIDQQVSAGPQAQGVMGLVLKWSNAHKPQDDSCPRTAWFANKERFTTRARTIDHERGLLRLVGAHDKWNLGKDSPFDVYQVDPDGAALKTVNFLLSAQNLIAKSLSLGAAGEVTYSTGDKQPVAALRSGGLGVSRHGRAEMIAKSAAAAALKDQAIQAGTASSQNVVLFTEDVLRGYRVDVQSMPGGTAQIWQSLCRRHGIYRFIGTSDTIDVSGRRRVCQGRIDDQYRERRRRPRRSLPARIALPMDRLEPGRAASRPHAAVAYRSGERRARRGARGGEGRGDDRRERPGGELRRGEKQPAQTPLRCSLQVPRADRRSGRQQPRSEGSVPRDRRQRHTTRHLLALRTGRSSCARAPCANQRRRVPRAHGDPQQLECGNRRLSHDPEIPGRTLTASVGGLRVHERQRTTRRATEVVPTSVRAAWTVRRTVCKPGEHQDCVQYCRPRGRHPVRQGTVDEHRAGDARIAHRHCDDDFGTAEAAVRRQSHGRPAGAGTVRHPSREAGRNPVSARWRGGRGGAAADARLGAAWRQRPDGSRAERGGAAGAEPGARARGCAREGVARHTGVPDRARRAQRHAHRSVLHRDIRRRRRAEMG